uniref:Uncharacterized protein n=1 Tax=Oryza brachyantha TaxID=4533 RepID=J3N882_ORYBR
MFVCVLTPIAECMYFYGCNKTGLSSHNIQTFSKTTTNSRFSLQKTSCCMNYFTLDQFQRNSYIMVVVSENFEETLDGKLLCSQHCPVGHHLAASNLAHPRFASRDT